MQIQQAISEATIGDWVAAGTAVVVVLWWAARVEFRGRSNTRRIEESRETTKYIFKRLNGYIKERRENGKRD